MRDILIAALVFGALPWALSRPYVGVYLWAWLGYMNPHRLTYGFAASFPWAHMVAVVTLMSLLFSKEPKKLPMTREVVILILFLIWMTITTLFAINEARAWMQWEKVMKIQVMTFLTLMVINTRDRLNHLIWVIVLSLGYFGFKGGIFTLTGGGGRVQGPPGTFIAGNNELALALIVTIPLMWYLRSHAERKWVRHGMLVLMLLTAVSAIGTQSRGALVGLAAMGAMLWLKSRQKFMMLILILLASVAILAVMPESWYERMGTIKTYDEDASALGRINAWGMAINVASSRLTGGGFEVVSGATFRLYGPDPLDVHDFHSIYFEVLGEHGFIGLGLFLTLFGMAWLKCGGIIRQAKRNQEIRWAGDLAAMLQVSMMGYATAGTFLGMAYFDLPYHIMAIAVILSILVGQPANIVAEPMKGFSRRRARRPETARARMTRGA